MHGTIGEAKLTSGLDLFGRPVVRLTRPRDERSHDCNARTSVIPCQVIGARTALTFATCGRCRTSRGATLRTLRRDAVSFCASCGGPSRSVTSEKNPRRPSEQRAHSADAADFDYLACAAGSISSPSPSAFLFAACVSAIDLLLPSSGNFSALAAPLSRRCRSARFSACACRLGEYSLSRVRVR